MYELFYKYLIVNQKAGLPGVGNFYVQTIPSKIDIVNRTLSAPAQSVNFKAETALNERSFFDYLSKELKVNGIEAVALFNEFTHKIHENAILHGVVLPGIGTLKRNDQGVFSFHPEIKTNPTLPLIHLDNSVAANSNIVSVYDSGETKMIMQDTVAPEEEKIIMTESDDYWWVYAIILALMGLGALLYYYI